MSKKKIIKFLSYFCRSDAGYLCENSDIKEESWQYKIQIKGRRSRLDKRRTFISVYGSIGKLKVLGLTFKCIKINEREFIVSARTKRILSEVYKERCIND